MRRILLVDDDPDQLEIRKLIIHRAGHRVAIATNALDALTVFDAGRYDTVILDLRLPTPEEGLSLIRALRERSETVRLLVISGWPADIERQPERHLVQEVMAKPVKSAGLLKKLAQYACLALTLSSLPAQAAQTVQAALELRAPREVVADIELSAPGSQWNRKGREGAYARVLVNGKLAAHVPVFLGGQPLAQSILLGHLPAGKHQITVERDPRTPEGVELKTGPIKVRTFAPGDPEQLVMAHAPIVFARRDDLLFSDVPLLAYCERTRDRATGRLTLEYTVIFSNEDGGTSTRALMARWGRTTDIEYVYRVTFDASGRRLSGIIQTRGHADVEFAGEKEGEHPLLGVVTENNMVAPEGRSALRWAPAPVPADLANASRELVMDQAPWTYRVAAEELEREGKLRPFGTVDGQKISDPRHYLTFEARIASRDSRISPAVRLRTGPWRSAHIGRPDYAVERPGWARMSVELPPGAQSADIAELGFTCLTEPPNARKPAPLAGTCTVEAIGAVFLLNPDYTPGASLWTRPLDAPVTLESGQLVSLPWK